MREGQHITAVAMGRKGTVEAKNTALQANFSEQTCVIALSDFVKERAWCAFFPLKSTSSCYPLEMRPLCHLCWFSDRFGGRRLVREDEAGLYHVVRLPATKAVGIECFEIQIKRRCVLLHQFCDKMAGEWPQ